MKALFALVIISALLFYGCAGASQQPAAPAGGNAQQPPVPAQTGGNEVPQAPPAVGGNPSPPESPLANVSGTPHYPSSPQPLLKEFTIEASQWQFTPSTITVNRGDVVRITLKSMDVAHGMAIPDFGFDLKVDAGGTATGQFTASQSGTFTFFCNVPCGEGHRNMKGTLVVN